MITIKSIQATPILSGKDAASLLKQVNTPPTQEALKKNQMLCTILEKVRKA